MLVIKNQEHLTRVLAFASGKGPQHIAWLNEGLWRLHIWSDGIEGHYDMPADTVWPAEGLPPAWTDKASGRVRTEIGRDFAAASFAWIAIANEGVRKGRVMINGGLIYHGDQRGWRDDEVYIPPFSVELTRNQGDNPWSLHT